MSVHECWVQSCFFVCCALFQTIFPDSLSMLRLPQQDNPPVSHKMAASVIYNNLWELAEEQSTGGNGGWGGVGARVGLVPNEIAN